MAGPGCWFIGSASLLGFIGTTLAQQGPSQSEQERRLAAIRDYAAHYSAQLPDYTCVQVTERDHHPMALVSAYNPEVTGGAKFGLPLWSSVITEEVSVAGGRASLRVLKIDGRPSNLRHSDLSSTISAVEFVTILRRVFAVNSGASFHWVRNEKLRGRPVLVFGFDVPESRGVTIYDPELAGRQFHVGFTGLAYSDAASNAVMRITLHIAVPLKASALGGQSDDPGLSGLDMTLDYKAMSRGGHEFVLPDRFEVAWHRKRPDTSSQGSLGRTLISEETSTHGEFKDYRFESAKSSIDYSDDQSLPNGEAHSILIFGDDAAPSSERR
jgi:hypothetical protein